MKNETIRQAPNNKRAAASPARVQREIPYSSNSIRLSLRELLVVAIVFGVFAFLAPVLWPHAEKIDPDPDFRLGYEFSYDYYLYERYCKWAAERYDTLLVGDSVVWGHYVSKDNTLSAHLNKLTGRSRFANLGVDGTHPAALLGLLRYYAKAITGKNVVLHLNLLWMSSAKADLRTEKEHDFNHSELVPQFTPRIPCYKAAYAERISAVLKNNIPLFKWTSHINITYFDSNDVPTWTVDHPYDCPFRQVTFTLPTSDNYERDARPAEPGGNYTLEWVDLEKSLQWRFFRQSVELLRQRNNRVFVLLGPFNEHLLAPESLARYRTMQTEVAAWLTRNSIPHYIPAVLDPDQYTDASHPLAAGYTRLAADLLKDPAFTSTNAAD